MWRAVLISVAMTALTAQAITTRTEEMKLIYPEKVRSERDLAVCEQNEVCSVVHRRFFQLPAIQRLCRCVTGLECPWNWSWAPDNQTMALNNRAQLKFCESLWELPECPANVPAINMTVRTTVEQLAARKNKTHVTVRRLTTAECRCANERYWKHHGTAHQDLHNGTTTDTESYRCQGLRKCLPAEFCGSIRADYFATHYRCSCPTHHLCLFRDRMARNATELLYTGPAYDGVCTRHGQPDQP